MKWIEIPEDGGVTLLRANDIDKIWCGEYEPEFSEEKYLLVILYLKDRVERYKFKKLREGYEFYYDIKNQLGEE